MSDAQQQRYTEIERQYSQGQWQAVLEGSAALLAELPDHPGDPLRTRLTLLQGHTLLYGLGQLQEAAAIYRQVLAGEPEALLASIAQQELDRCMGQLEAMAAPAPAPEAAAAFPFSSGPMGAEARPQQRSAMPWLEALGGVDPAPTPHPQPSATAAQAPWMQPQEPQQSQQPLPEPLAADVIDEPEQIEVHQADPTQAEVVDLALLDLSMASRDQKSPGAALDEPEAESAAGVLAEAEPSQRPEAEPEELPAALTQPRWSPAEEAELARGLLTVVLR
jgi:hypothetical protein